ncbi:hypothetical protein GFY24_23015 [Nocardia sp. SYP-A9097]|uniref:hypothetical protein n=1 Tax=Nocardia sp. SYP-A9097 TaxID=2663237 RepID=UPI00129A37ED|nr:hypothetical protein [Nocardia sp. SYP-A9097]MRH90273.1 hypothetical protein [Nocardia sp. SYP-A9097]
MESADIPARIFAGLGGLVAAGLIPLYGLALLFGVIGGIPDEDPEPAVQNVLLVIKAIVVAAAASTLVTGAITGRTMAIIGGCLLFILDFVLLSVWYSNVLVPPGSLPIERETPPNPPEIVLTAWVVWVVFPVLTMLLAVARGRHSASA